MSSPYVILISMKTHLLALFYLLFAIYFPPTVLAASEFTTAFTSTYTIGSNGLTDVAHEILLTNQLAHIYTTEYTLAVGSDRLTNIQALAGGVKAPTAVDQQGAATTITVKIPHPVIGYNQTTKLEIRYRTPDIASMLGNTLSVNIPRLSKGNEASVFKRIIRLPTVLPPLASVSPPLEEKHLEDNFLVYTFSTHPGDSITMLFGDEVTYHLDLSYEITASGLSGSITEIALPPDTAYQQVILDSLEPEPSEIIVDPDGNWLARYSLKSQEKKQVKAQLFITLSPTPRFYDPSTRSPELTSPKEFWEAHNPLVVELAAQLKSTENIYDYLVNNFTYNYARVKPGTVRLGALQALASPSDAICTEFTDTFIALARSLGIPAREINGYAYSDNPLTRPLSLETDVLHSWAEYYDVDAQIWRSVDPTWGHTTGGINYFNLLDFNHLTFVRRGLESAYPLPAGVYKTSGQSKQVIVEVAEKPNTKPAYRIERAGNDFLILNSGKTALVNTELEYQGQKLFVNYLPPYGRLLVKDPQLAREYGRYVPLAALALLAFLAALVLFFLRRQKREF